MGTRQALRIRIEIVELPIYLQQIDERIPGFLKDLQPLMRATQQILAAPASDNLRKAVQAQVAVADQHFGGMLAASANGFGLPAEATARNLFDLVVGTLYLMRNPRLLDDFIEFGKLTFYRLMKNLSPESPQYQQSRLRDLAKYDAEIKRLEAKFKKKNSWHGRQTAQVAKDSGIHMEQLYKIVYKTASAITHGSSYPVLSRNKNLEWVIGFQKHQWDRYVKESLVLGYSMLTDFYNEVFRLFQIADSTNLNAMHDVCMKLNG
jgi:hypothetical protein